MKYNLRKLIAVSMCALLFCGCGCVGEESQNTGGYVTFSQMNEGTEFKLPGRIEELANSNLNTTNYTANVKKADSVEFELVAAKRMKDIGRFASDYSDPVANTSDLYADILKNQLDVSNARVFDFDGTTSTELMKAIEEHPKQIINIKSDVIAVDETLVLPEYTYIQGNGCLLFAAELEDIIRVEGTDSVFLGDLRMTGGAKHGIEIVDSKKVVVNGCDISKMENRGVYIHGDSTYVTLAGNRISDNANGGIYVNENVSRCLFYKNNSFDNRGCMNESAGFALGDMERIKSYTPGDKEGAANYPHEIILYKNKSNDNQSGGYYCAAVYDCCFIANEASGNQKEGSCLDWDTFGCYLLANAYEENGRRAEQDEFILEYDDVAADGLMDDGAAWAKLPGLSIDNGLYNTVEKCTFTGNYGTGLKVVRCGVGNIIYDNTFVDNNAGENEKYHFFALELAGEETFGEGIGMDFGPSVDNYVAYNKSFGAHYSTLFIGPGSYNNHIEYNTSSGEKYFMIESISLLQNYYHNNRGDRENRIEGETTF